MSTRNKQLIFVLAFCLCAAGCTAYLKKPVEEELEPVQFPVSRFLTLSQEQLLLLDWRIGYKGGAHLKDKRIVPGAGVEFDIYFPSNSPDSRSLDIVSSGKGGRGDLVGADVQGYDTYALKLTLVSVNGQSEPDMKQRVVAGAVIGPTDRGQLRTYEPFTLSMAASEKTVIAKTSVSSDKIYQIGFHVHMQNPEDWDQSGSIMRLRVEPAGIEIDVNDIADSYSVQSSDGAPVITSAPVTTATAEILYRYDVNAIDPDVGDTLTYSLTTKPAGMTIDPATGLIMWQPAADKGETKELVVVKVTDSNSIPAAATQSFNISVKPTPFKRTKLGVISGYDQRSKKPLSAEDKVNLVQASDNNRLEIYFGSSTSYDFSDIDIPSNAILRSVVVFVEHFEEERFAQGKLEWSIGRGWPFRKVVLASLMAEVHIGESDEAVDSWDITSLVDTNEKINDLQLEIKNNNSLNSKTLIDHVYVIVTLE
ncbi:MAG: Ig domain-containing protein [Sedimentisphaerales bacterium]|nr:Ig domain-containing protein [Sedimentisphaerales bacterium]